MTVSAELQEQLEDALDVAHDYLDHPLVQPLLERLSVTLKMIHTPEPPSDDLRLFGMDLVDVIARDLQLELAWEIEQQGKLP